MNPDLEDFLEAAFAAIQPTASAIGRVVIEPNYETDSAQSDAAPLSQELVRLLREQSLDSASLASTAGVEVFIPDRYPLLQKYVLRLELHANKLDGSWVEIAPPGNWI